MSIQFNALEFKPTFWRQKFISFLYFINTKIALSVRKTDGQFTLFIEVDQKRDLNNVCWSLEPFKVHFRRCISTIICLMYINRCVKAEVHLHYKIIKNVHLIRHWQSGTRNYTKLSADISYCRCNYLVVCGPPSMS